MQRPDFGDLKRVRIDPELLSRGTGQPVTLQEAVVYDFMPPILGNRFRVDEALRRGVHFFSGSGSFMMMEEAYKTLATQGLDAGNLAPALEAYKRGLHSVVGFVSAMAMLEDGALLSPTEIERFDLQRSFGPIERRLIVAIIEAGEDTKIDLLDYAEWVAGVRRLEREAIKLNNQFFGRVKKHPDNPEIKWTDPDYWDQSLVGNREIGIRSRDIFVQMQRYGFAAWMSKEIGDTEAEARYAELAKSDPEELPGYREIYSSIQDREERYRYPERFENN